MAAGETRSWPLANESSPQVNATQLHSHNHRLELSFAHLLFDVPRARWPLTSLFAVGIAQQPMLVGLTLPAYSVHFSSVAAKPFGAVDAGVSCLCLAGILTAMFADNTLYS